MKEITFEFKRRQPSNPEIYAAVLSVYLLASEAAINVYGESYFTVKDVMDYSYMSGKALKFPDETYFIELEDGMVYIDRAFFIEGNKQNIYIAVHSENEESCRFIELC